ncbi:MAG: NUDIX hydrolase [Candidatus Micrarchaeota archaeon]
MEFQELNVYIVAYYKEKLLLMKRHDGIWEFPGGGVDWGENPEISASREFREETGMTPKDMTLLGITSATYKKRDDDKHSVYIVYRTTVESDKVIISREHSEARWLLPNEMKYMKLGLNAEPVLEMI